MLITRESEEIRIMTFNTLKDKCHGINEAYSLILIKFTDIGECSNKTGEENKDRKGVAVPPGPAFGYAAES